MEVISLALLGWLYPVRRQLYSSLSGLGRVILTLATLAFVLKPHVQFYDMII